MLHKGLRPDHSFGVGAIAILADEDPLNFRNIPMYEHTKYTKKSPIAKDIINIC